MARRSTPALWPLATLMLCLLSSAAQAQSHFGDLNQNGRVDVGDVTRALAYAVGTVVPTPQQAFRADVAPLRPDGWFGDGQVNTADVLRILQRAVGLEPGEPWPHRRVLVAFDPQVTDAQAARVLDRVVSPAEGAVFEAHTPVASVVSLHACVLSPGVGMDGASQALTAAAAAENLPEGVRYVEPDHLVYTTRLSNDPAFGFGLQWGLQQAGLPDAWDLTTGSAKVAIAILDTGISRDHPDLVGKVIQVQNVSEDSGDDDLNGHGTHVAGIAAADTNNGVGIAGVSWASPLLEVRVMNRQGEASQAAVTAGLWWLVDWATQNPDFRVVANLSLGSDAPSRTLRDAVRAAAAKGIVMVAAAGNDGTDWESYPAAFPECIAVAASGKTDHLADFSNWGEWVTLGAPGVGIYSTLPQGDTTISAELGLHGYGELDGTSMASPLVAGVCALLLGLDPTLTPAQVKETLVSTATPLTVASGEPALGRLDARKALRALAPSPGDLNRDGQVTVSDVVIALRFAAGLGTPSALELLGADLNANGRVDITDVVALLRLALGAGS